MAAVVVAFALLFGAEAFVAAVFLAVAVVFLAVDFVALVAWVRVVFAFAVVVVAGGAVALVDSWPRIRPRAPRRAWPGRRTRWSRW